MPKAVLILLLSFGFFRLAAQEESSKMYIIPEEYVKIHHAGEQALLQLKYKDALSNFKKVLKKFPDFAPAMRSAGACYELMGEFEEASEFYLQALEDNPRFSRALYYESARMFYQTGKYRQALEYFQQFDSLRNFEPTYFAYNGVEELKIELSYYEKLPGSIRACTVALDSMQFLNISSVINLGNGINSAADEYFPFLSNDGNTIYYTTRKNARADENLFFSTRPKGDWQGGGPLEGFNSPENEGMATMVRDGRRIFFTACQRPAVLGPCDIWEADMEGHHIFDEKPVVGYANSGGWESQASISCDGSTLYFASNREGGFGGADIWVSNRRDDGRWSEPVNLGPNINTTGDEEAPFITNDGKVLYFSSTGHLGLGEQDIFMSRVSEDGDWSFAVNLGIPVNSAYRELGFYLTADGKTGYFASNRKGGFGGMDIYQFDLPEQLASDPITYVEGFVRDSITHLPVKTTVYFDHHPAVETDENGRFFLCIKALDTLKMNIRAEDYHPYRNRFAIPVWDNRAFYNLNLLLDPLFRLPVYAGNLSEDRGLPLLTSGHSLEMRHTILFEFDNAELKPNDLDKLDAFLDDAFTGRSVQNVEIVGYADDIGTDIYNIALSEKRAKSVGVHLKNKGVRVDKIYIEGRGEANNSRPKWQNRKVEVVVYLAK
jgi:Tol biopolymer transport system component